ncbi:hypothetical protein WA026_014469 [Henosepilachna vigintioctopunctata]|uniref:Major facilitator superfamily (MFS) profile domain-containing protein n=1 Tax=Henosepilachna vigintioctopunctata TaxID=420089 RepID=A0AAW1UJW2_9CUCU
MARVHPESLSRLTMEDIIEETGWGLYSKVMVGVTSACAFCQAVAILALCLALPLAMCDSFMNESTVLTVNLCFFLGRAIGGFILNSMSDITGRLWLLPNSLLVIFCSAFLAAFSHSGSSLSVALFILGSGLEANIRASKIHLAEILPKNKRGFYFIIPSFFWSVGYILMIGCGWKLSQHVIVEHRGTEMKLTAWRLLFAIAGGCNILVACITALVQPSPRYRLLMKQYTLANLSLKLFYSINKSKYSETWPLREEDITGIISDFQINTERRPLNCTEQMRLLLRRMFKTVCLLFKRRFIITTTGLILVRILFFFGIVPVHLLMTKTLLIQNSTCEISGYDLFHLYRPVDKDCKLRTNMVFFPTFLLLAPNIMLGQLFILHLVDHIGRRLIIVFGSFLCAITASALTYWDMDLFFWNQQFYIKIVFCAIFLIGYSIVQHTLEIIETEAFPTVARGTAAGIVSFYPNFIFCVVCTVWYMSCGVTYISLGLIFAISILVTYFLPELRRLPMVE